MLPNPQFPMHLVTFTEEILNGKPHFLCSVIVYAYVTHPLKTLKRLGTVKYLQT